MNARWIRLGRIEPAGFELACARLAAAQARSAAPILAWAQAEQQYLFTLIAPRKLAPGRSARWLSWALAPAVATYRQFDLPAYLDLDGIWLHGRKIAAAGAQPIGECVVAGSSFLRRFPGSCVATPSHELEQAFRLRLEAQHGWQFDHSWPSRPEAVSLARAELL
ncbi:MAG: hypothetical protein A3G28_01760 [Betaproteobacteria bacterium RIFCSPLOWO2_12_FULL_68_19]|nr:MAG: hypothetical protein A3G28_01760 [Betaproteobacteria bacterium RIFCSPLOWO2_12_FULL_68_19]